MTRRFGPFRWHIALLFAGIALQLSGCTVPLTERTFTTPFLEKNPSAVLGAMMAAERDAAGATNYSVTLDVSGEHAGVTGSATLQGAADHDMASAMMTMSVTIDYAGVSFPVGMETRIVDGVTYLKIASFPDLSLPGLDTSAFVDKWIELDIDELPSMGLTSQSDDTSLSVSPDTLSDALSIVRRLPDRTISGARTYIYEVNIQTDALAQLMEEAGLPDIPISTSNVSDSLTTFEETHTLLIGVDKDSYRLRWISIEPRSSVTADDTTLTLEYTVTGFPASVDVQKPDADTTLTDVVSGLLGGTSLSLLFATSSETTAAPLDYLRVAELHSLQNDLELYYSLHDAYPAVLDDVTDDPYAMTDAVDAEASMRSPYVYTPVDDGASYTLAATLEDGTSQYGPGAITFTPSLIEGQPPSSERSVSVDTDGDGLSDILEELYATDPEDADTDGDGYTDGTEVENGYNPLGEGASGDVLGVSTIIEALLGQ